MDGLKFEWAKKKERSNIKKHGISFTEASTTFYDEKAIQFFDPDHSEDEDRFILLGISFTLKILVVCHCFRESEAVVRLISARRQTAMSNRNIGGEEDERTLRFLQTESS